MEGNFRTSQGALSIFEAEAFIKELSFNTVADIGTEKWMQQHEWLEKLNIQAHHSALTKHDEFVVDLIVSYEKIPVLVNELLAIEAWKENVFPLIVDKVPATCSVKCYMVMYHEATVVNLLEVILYHLNACQSADDAMLELADYCYRKLTLLNSNAFAALHKAEEKKIDVRALEEESTADCLRKQALEISFACAICALTLTRFITEHLPSLPVQMSTLLLHHQDLPLSLVNLIECVPWQRKKDGKVQRYHLLFFVVDLIVASLLRTHACSLMRAFVSCSRIRFIDQRWQFVPEEEMHRLGKLDGQVLFNFFICHLNLGYNIW